MLLLSGVQLRKAIGKMQAAPACGGSATAGYQLVATINDRPRLLVVSAGRDLDEWTSCHNLILGIRFLVG